MLNDELFAALVEIFGEPGPVSNQDKSGEYTVPKKKSICFSNKQKRFAQVMHWGESYRFNCPMCGDTRQRLYFSHLYGAKVYPKGTKTPVFFGNSLVHCFNEGCHRLPEFKQYLEDLNTKINKKITIVQADKSPVQKKFTKFLETETTLPSPNYSIASDDLPGCVYDFLAKRRLDAQELDNFYMCRFAPQGAKWKNKDTSTVFREDRLLIPIMQRRKMVSWQARKIMDSGANKKYLFEPGTKASHYLYNMDRAWRYKTVVICEGVTDVWRIGEDEDRSIGAVALFGKTITPTQQEILKTMWGYDGKGVVMLDSDASREADVIYRFLKGYNVFPRGVYKIQLKEGDPDNYERNELRKLIHEVDQKN